MMLRVESLGSRQVLQCQQVVVRGARRHGWQRKMGVVGQRGWVARGQMVVVVGKGEGRMRVTEVEEG